MVPPAGGADTTPPVLEIIGPSSDEWSRFPRVVVTYGDGGSGVDPASIQVTLDQPLGDGSHPAGTHIGDLAYRSDATAFVAPLAPPSSVPLGSLVTITARVRDVAGNESVATRSFFTSIDSAMLPTAAFAANTPPMNPLDFSADASTDQDGRIMRWEWYFGDGTTGVGRNVTKRFDAAGTYDVMLLVRDDQGGVATASESVTVDGPPPEEGGGGMGGGGNGSGPGAGPGAGPGSTGVGGGAAEDGGGDDGCDCRSAHDRPAGGTALLAAIVAWLIRRRRGALRSPRLSA
jgi:MYXO-CTERM domain-containing protein